jgi:hypothetical protein
VAKDGIVSVDGPDPTVTLSHFLSTFDLLQRQISVPAQLQELSGDAFPVRLAWMTKEFVGRLRSIELPELSTEAARALDDFETNWLPVLPADDPAAVFTEKHIQGETKLDDESFGSRGKLRS